MIYRTGSLFTLFGQEIALTLHRFWNRILKIFLYNQISFLQCDISSRIYNVFWEKIWFSWKTVSTKHSRAYKLCYGEPFQFCIYNWLFLWWDSHRSSISYFLFNSVGKLDCCYFTDPEFYFSLVIKCVLVSLAAYNTHLYTPSKPAQ